MAMSMTLRRRLADWAVAAVLILVPALVLRSSSKSGGLTSFDRGVLRVTSPLSATASWFAEGTGSLWHGYVGLVDVERENRELRAENERLRLELGQQSALALDAAALADLVALKQRTPSEMIGGRVIAAPLSPLFRVIRIRIDRGKQEVELAMPVIAGGGLVGRISRVYSNYADVMLVTDPGSFVDVMVARTGARGTVSGQGVDDSYECKLQLVDNVGIPNDGPSPETSGVQIGDTVVTSGKGKVFPAGIPVGFVTAVAAKNSGLYQSVTIEPLVDMSQLRAVMVLLAPPPPPDPDAGKKPRDATFGQKAY